MSNAYQPILTCSASPEVRGVYVSEPSEKMGISCSGYILNHHGDRLWVQASSVSDMLREGSFPLNLVTFDTVGMAGSEKVILLKDFVSISDRDSTAEMSCGSSGAESG